MKPIGNESKVCQYNWHNVGSLGWPFPMLKYEYIFQIKYTEAIFQIEITKTIIIAVGLMAIDRYVWCPRCHAVSCFMPIGANGNRYLFALPFKTSPKTKT